MQFELWQFDKVFEMAAAWSLLLTWRAKMAAAAFIFMHSSFLFRQVCETKHLTSKKGHKTI